MITQLYLEQYLWSTALSEAVSNGYYFGDECEIVTRYLIQISARKMMKDGSAQKTAAVLMAVENTRNLVWEMITIVAKTNDRKRLRERSVVIALGKLCPLFPFC